MRTPKLSGVFDVRRYNKNQKHNERQFLADDETITFSATFPNDQHQIPDGLAYEAKPFASRKEREDAEHEHREPKLDRVSVRFKIGSRVKWYGADGQPCARPTNQDLEAKRYNVMIEYNYKPKTDDPLSPSGNWVNAIMIEEVNENPFADCAFQQSAPAQTPAQAPAVDSVADAAEELADDGLPF